MTNNNFCVIIPARLNSNRLPNKVLIEIKKIPMVIRVAMQSKKSKAKNVFVATDSQKVIDVCIKYNINYFITSSFHQSGTERIVEVIRKNFINEKIIINVQADEPLIEPTTINLLANHIINNKTPMATIASYITNKKDLINPNIVKVIKNESNNALYFSRSPIPFSLNNLNEFLDEKIYLKHIGIYAYEKSFLYNYNDLKISQIEKIESLEQLRVLYNGFKISVLTLENIIHSGIDTLEDLNNINILFKNK